MNINEFVAFLDADKFEYEDSCIFFEQEDLTVFIKNNGLITLCMEFKGSYDRVSTNTCSVTTCLSAFRQTKALLSMIVGIGFSINTEFYDKDDHGDYRQRLGPLLGFEARSSTSKVWRIAAKQ